MNSIWLKFSHLEQYTSQEPEPETFKLSFLDFSLLYAVCRLWHSHFMSSLLNFPWNFSTSFTKKEFLKFQSRYSIRWWFHRAGFELKKSNHVSQTSKSNFTFSAFSSSFVKKDNLSKNFYFFGALSLYFFDSLLKALQRARKFLSRKSSENLPSKRLLKSSFTADLSSLFQI